MDPTVAASGLKLDNCLVEFITSQETIPIPQNLKLIKQKNQWREIFTPIWRYETKPNRNQILPKVTRFFTRQAIIEQISSGGTSVVCNSPEGPGTSITFY